jgi:hypothetical protein
MNYAMSMVPALMTAEIGTNFWDFLQNPTVIVTIAIFAFTVFAKSIIGIFKLGVFFSEREMSQRQVKFEKQVIDDMRSYKDELLKVTMTAAMETINDKLKNVDSIERTAQEMKATEARLDIQIKNAMEKVEEVRGMSDNLRSLNAKVDRLQYGQENQDVRRREK